MGKINFTLNGKRHSCEEGLTILQAARAEGVEIPTLCHLKDVCVGGTCKVCLVAVAGKERPVQACVTKIMEGMVVDTDTPEVFEARKDSLEKIASDHHFQCEYCIRYTDCELYKLMIQYAVNENKLTYGKNMEQFSKPVDTSAEFLVKDHGKCIGCRRCLNVCEKVQGIHAIRSKNGVIGPETTLDAAGCTHCGQCISTCPTGALGEVNETRWVWKHIYHKDKYMVAVLSPYSAAAFAERFHFPMGEAGAQGKLVTALRCLGFHAVYDGGTGLSVAAGDLAASIQGGNKMMVSTACPAFLRLCAEKYPEFGVAESSGEAFAKLCRIDAQKKTDQDVFLVQITPCTAEKQKSYEDLVYDAVLTTNELTSMWHRGCVSRFTARDTWKKLEPGIFDEIEGIDCCKVAVSPNGGILENAIRIATGTDVKFGCADPQTGIAEVTYQVDGTVRKAARVAGLARAQAMLRGLSGGEVKYDAIEVMACPSGCIGGGGQPRQHSKDYGNDLSVRFQALQDAVR